MWFRTLALYLSLLISAHADPLFDFGTFTMPTPQQLRMPQPRVNWHISKYPAQTCQQIQPQDGRIDWQGACATWHLASNQCTLVTTADTTHSVLGHLFLGCLTARSKP